MNNSAGRVIDRHPGLLVPDWTVVPWCTFAAAERQGHVPALEEFRSLYEEVRDEAGVRC